MTVEHLLGCSQGGYPDQIKAVVAERFPGLPERQALVQRIDAANTVTACSFCNSATHARDTRQMLNAADGAPEQVAAAIVAELKLVLPEKQRQVQWKLQSVREAFDTLVKPALSN